MPPAEALAPHAIPILIGVAGHRDIADAARPAVIGAVEGVLAEIRALAPRTPLVVLSSLAEGADQLVARVAVDAGARLWVSLPLAREEFRRDFSDRGRREFDALLSRAEVVTEVGLAPGNTDVGIRHAGAQRDEQYALASRWIVRRCHAMIALWDGEEARGAAGTAAVVSWQLERVGAGGFRDRAFRTSLSVAEGGPILQVVAPRGEAAAASVQAGKLIRRYPDAPDDDPEAADRLAGILRRIDEANAEFAGWAASRDAGRVTGSGMFRSTFDLGNLPIAARRSLERFAAADAAALSHQGFSRVAVPWVFASGFLSVLCLELFAHVFTGNPWWLGAYLVAFLGGFAVMWGVRHREHEHGHIEYRALAEAMRLQTYWRLVGSSAWVGDQYLRVHRSSLDWVREALRAWCASPQDEARTLADPAAWDEVRASWVSAQASWLRHKAEKNHHAHRRWRLWSITGLGAGLLTSLVLFFLLVARAARYGEVHEVPHYVHFMIVASALLMLAGALCRAYAASMGFEAESVRYRLMTPVFERAELRLRTLLEADRRGDAVRLLEELGREALAENAEWLLARRERKLEPAAGG